MTNPIPLFIFRATSAISIPDSESPKKKRFLDGYHRRASTEIDEVDKYFAEENGITSQRNQCFGSLSQHQDDL